jgi:hypothetical protein
MLHRRLDHILSKARRIRVGSTHWIEVAGGLPRNVFHRRRAFAGGQMIEPEPGEARDTFEWRIGALAGYGPVVLGGLPPLPGTDTLPPEVMDPGDTKDYWGDPDEDGDVTPET